ncbi:hypothetical protein ACFRAO_32875 [Streptomyces sp. NPDC056656]
MEVSAAHCQGQGLEGQWRRGEEVTAEDLRLASALRQYRSFFDRLLSA